MKKYINNILRTAGLSLVFVLALSSCEKWIDTSINTDPDAPADVPMNLMLPAIEQAFGYNMAGNDLVRTTNIWMQQFDGVDRQSYTEARYQLLPSDVNNIWNSFYTSIFMNSKVLLNKAENTQSPHNAGVARVLIASTLGITTDLFGDMPFSKGFRGNENILTPTFDAQQKLYDTLFTILDRAITDLSSTSNSVSIGGDVIYSGSAAKWKKAAYSIKARHLLQLSLVNGDAAYTAAITAAASGFSSNSDDFAVPWNVDNKNPIFQFMEQRTDVRMGATLVDMLKAVSDPRLPFYANVDGDGEYTGSVSGSQTDLASKPGSYIAAYDAPSVIMSYAELKFIEAEAHFRLGHTGPAQAAYEAAVAASVLKVTGNANTAWLTANINGVPVTLDLILTQKYIATFGTNQAYADYRRTGLPAMTLPIGAVLTAMPVRFPYAQEEITYNSANVPSVTISDKLWWDR
ncbi:MAG: SusD/RagB family nutrient-binding outer membrane lipoprotein [Bacteroidia bacterium]|nr:MAG: SusD/RagB family nutrient-binding outer membrane lipoprotein [Bacteroidia bacterium]